MRTYNEIERPDYTPEFITELKADEVFVFGSNLAGMHGGGAAYVAFKRDGLWSRPSWAELCHPHNAGRGGDHQAVCG